MYQIEHGINYSEHKPGKGWKFYHTYKCSRFGLTDNAITAMELDLYMDKIDPSTARIFMEKEGSFYFADLYIKQ